MCIAQKLAYKSARNWCRASFTHELTKSAVDDTQEPERSFIRQKTLPVHFFLQLRDEARVRVLLYTQTFAPATIYDNCSKFRFSAAAVVEEGGGRVYDDARFIKTFHYF